MINEGGKFIKGHSPWNKGKKLPQFSGINHSNWKGGIKKNIRGYKNPPKLICQYCKKEFVLSYRIPHKELQNRQFCSRKCHYIFRDLYYKPSKETCEKIKKALTGRIISKEHKEKSSKGWFKRGIIPWNKNKEFWQIRGENHPNWQGGKSFEPYPLGWTKTYREQIRFRDNYKCQTCGCPEVECKRKLSIHHIDYNKNNLNPNNLTSICVSCHMKTNYNHNYWINHFKKERINV